MKTHIIIIAITLGLVSSLSNQKQLSKVMVQNIYGEVISWQKFPVSFNFHKNFPIDKRIIVEQEIAKFNGIVGQEIFKINNQQITQMQPIKNQPDSINTIYWDFNSAFNMNQSEQGKTSVFWVGANINETDINIQSSTLNGLDFATLIRHELFHSLGVKHIDNTLMNAYLPLAVVREWDPELIIQWKKDISKYAHIKFSVKPESSNMASQK